MHIDRREFVKLTVSAVTTCAMCGCASGQRVEGKPVPRPEVSRAGSSVDCGQQTRYQKEGIYDTFADRGFFLVRHGPELLAFASICTHRNCKLRPQKDLTILCPCHGSKFDEEGKVTRGPAKRDLPRFQTRIDDRGHVLVSLESA